MPKITKIRLRVTKLSQKQKGCAFFETQCSISICQLSRLDFVY